MRQSVKWEVWPYRTCAFIVVAFRLRTTVGGSLQGLSTATTGGGNNAIGCARTGGQCDWRAPNGLSDKTLRIFEKAKSFSSTRCTASVCV